LLSVEPIFDVAGTANDRHHEDAIRHREAGGRAHLEYRIPTEKMDSFNAAIVGTIAVTQIFS